MKFFKFVLAILILNNISYANYSVVVPLEQSNGGSLENGTINFQASENWVSASPLYTNWINNGNLYDCTNWSPLENTINIGISFEQTATDCKQDQTRTRQDREQETTTLDYRNVGSPVEENQTLTNQTNTRNAIGTMESWVSTDPIYTVWINSGEIYGCTNWSPLENTVGLGTNFEQTATDCKQDQIRTRQDREQETTTLVYRDVGSIIEENQTLSNQINTRNAVGTMETWVAATPVYTSWVNSGGIYGCSNWSPATSTVTIGQNFTQTATDCEQDQTRTRQNREQETTTLVYRNSGSLVTENQTLSNQTSTRNAVGTKETWVATTPVYTSWVNSGGIYGCSNWSPATSTVTSGQTFTQTATDCKQDQTRTRQDREQETTTLAIRNAGSLVTENQTLTNQSNTRTATGTKVSTECKFDNPYGHTSNPQYYWVIEENVNSATHDPTALVWNNATLNTSYSQYYYDWENMPKNLTSLTHAGYTYTRGPLWGDDGVYRFYTICRTPL